MKRVCKKCGEFKEHYAKGLCRDCYREKYKNEHHREICEKAKIYSREYRKKNPQKVKKSLKKWRKNNKEYRREYQRKYRMKNRDKFKAWAKKSYLKNREKRLQKGKEYYTRHREKKIQVSKQYYIENKEHVKEYHRRYQQENPGKAREHTYRRRINGTVKKGVTDQVITENMFQYGRITCEKCKEECEANYHIDHIKPISKGGTHEYHNLQVLCAKCNMEKHTREARYIQNISEKQLFLGVS